VKEKVIQLYGNSLFRNSFFPMLATAVMSGLGFVFWLLVARLFSTDEVGIAATLLSVMAMTSALSLAGFDTAIIRFLAHDKNRNNTLNTSIVLVGLVAFILSSLFVIGVHFFSPHLEFIQKTPLTAGAFILLSVMASINILTDSIFLALRQTKYSFFIDTTFSTLKVVLPFAFIGWGAFGVFMASAVAQSIGFFLSIATLMRRFEYRPAFIVDRNVLAKVWRYSAGNYLADIFNFLPGALLPIIIVNNLGPHASAYFYIIMMIAGLLYVIPNAVTRSLFAEGSYDEANIATHLRNTVRTIAYILTPAMLILLVAGKYLLLLFGAEYSTEGVTFLSIMTLASIVVTTSSVMGSLFRINHNVRGLIIRNLSYALSIIGLTYLFLPYGLPGVGLAYAGGNLVATLVSLFMYVRGIRKGGHAPVICPRGDRTYREFFLNLIQKAWVRFTEIVLLPLLTVVSCKATYLKAVLKKGFRKRPTILFYPERPKTFHVLYKACHILGYTMVFDPSKHADIIINFNDTTVQAKNPVLEELRKTRRIVNIDAIDISKRRVEIVFEEVFGYPLAVDPRTHVGPCVRKSDMNAVHDGRVVTCPTEPVDGYVYQKLICSDGGEGRVMDLRVYIFNGKIPFVLKRYKSIDDRFDRTIEAKLAKTSDILSDDEVSRIALFCARMGLDYGELDALRSGDDGRIYIVDVNNTPAGPLSVLGKDREEFPLWIDTLCTMFNDEFCAPPFTTPTPSEHAVEEVSGCSTSPSLTQ
jgi:O-antigen/teichoic acid export membrane protein